VRFSNNEQEEVRLSDNEQEEVRFPDNEQEEVRFSDNEREIHPLQSLPEVTSIPATPPRKKRTHSLVMRTPDKLATPPWAPPPRPSSPILEEASPPPPQSTAFELPPSTAPARLHRPERARKLTAKLVTARREGWLPKSLPNKCNTKISVQKGY